MVRLRLRPGEEQDFMSKFAVIGLGRFGYKLALTLAREGGDVVAIDSRPEPVDHIKDHVSVALCLDATDEEALKIQGIDEVDTAIVSIGAKFEENVLATALLKQMGVSRVYSRSSEGLQSRILELVGADRVIHPEEDMALKLAESLMIRGIGDVIPITPEHNVAEIEAPKVFWGRSLRDLRLRNNYHINLIAIKQRDETGNSIILDSLPGPDTIIHEDQILIIVGKQEDIDALAWLK